MTEEQEKQLLRVIWDILNKGNSCEVKREKDKVVVVEIKRQVKIKTLIKG